MSKLSVARDIMVAQPLVLAPETTVLKAVGELLNSRFTGAPVADASGRYLGVFSEKCCMDALLEAADHVGELSKGLHQITARDAMTSELITLWPEMNAFDAITMLLQRKISGAPVVGPDMHFLGVFSEKTSMSVLLDAVYDQLPSRQVQSFMDVDSERIIDEETDLRSIAEIFLRTHYRRLPVLRGERLVGQVSRRDVLHAAFSLSQIRPLDLGSVGDKMDKQARTITEEIDLLHIASLFRQTPYRRLPVLEGEQLKGLVSRRDVLRATDAILTPAPRPAAERKLLYLSALNQEGAPPID